MKERAKSLRKTQTNAELTLWLALRKRRFCGYKFRRQRIIGTYIVDFVCLKNKLILEVDGCQHLDNQDYDKNRTLFLNSLGFRVLRFWNNQVLAELENVLNVIYCALTKPSSAPIGAPSPAIGRRTTTNNDLLKSASYRINTSEALNDAHKKQKLLKVSQNNSILSSCILRE